MTTAGMADADRLLYLLQVASSTFPTGAFAHSLGFETLVADDEIADADALATVCELWLRFSLGPLDGVAAARAHEAAAGDDLDALAEIDEVLGALKLPRESAEASITTGTAFLRAVESAFGGRHLRAYRGAIASGAGESHAATAFGVAAADAGVPVEQAVLAFLQSSFANLVGVVGRLVPLGQLDVQRVLAGARTSIASAASAATATRLEDASSAAAFLDIASMRHERLYTRLCIS